MQEVERDHFGKLVLGSFFLGSGGGFESPSAGLFTLRQLMLRPAPVVSLSSLADQDCVVLCTFFGSATVEIEKNQNVSCFEKLLEVIKKDQKREITAFVAPGIAGGVPSAPIFLASYFDIPILDADCAGRCFSELQTISTHVAGIYPKKAFMTNAVGDFFEIECNDFSALERHARRITVSSGGACIIVPQILTGEEAKRALIPGTLTQALTIGEILHETRDLNAVMDYTGGRVVGTGGVMSISGITLPDPFRKRIIIKNAEEGKTWDVYMGNEFDLIFENGECIAEVPDIITICNAYTREPLTFKYLMKNSNVTICVMKAPELWYSGKGLALAQSEEYLNAKEIIVKRKVEELGKTI